MSGVHLKPHRRRSPALLGESREHRRHDTYRERIWAELAKVARPDSRFHWDFSSFICDFQGSKKCSDRVLEMEALIRRGDRRVFIIPDNCKAQVVQELKKWIEVVKPKLLAIDEKSRPKELVKQISEALLATFTSSQLLDEYAIY